MDQTVGLGDVAAGDIRGGERVSAACWWWFEANPTWDYYRGDVTGGDQEAGEVGRPADCHLSKLTRSAAVGTRG